MFLMNTMTSIDTKKYEKNQDFWCGVISWPVEDTFYGCIAHCAVTILSSLTIIIGG